jgi:hypothetical protein
MSRPVTPVIAVADEWNRRNRVEETHPAFGVAIITRGQGTQRTLFQSDVLHSETVSLSIHTATRGRELNRDWIHSHEKLVDVEMSLAQWGALVSSVGMGSGVPVTLRCTESNSVVDAFPFKPRIEESLDDVGSTVDRLLDEIKRTLAVVQDAIDNKRPIGRLRDAMRDHAAAVANASANAEYAVRSLVDAGESVLSQVRADIESQVLNAQRLSDVRALIVAPQMPLRAIEGNDVVTD